MKTTAINRVLHQFFNPILFAALIAGFFIPGGERVPPQVLLVVLGSMIFASSFRIDLTEIRRFNVPQIGIFWVARFLLLPGLLFFITAWLYRPLAPAILLFALMPAGVVSPGVSSMYKGNTSLSIFIVIVSSILAPFVVPPVLSLLLSQQVVVETRGIFQTLVVTVFIPLALHLPFRRSKRFSRWMNDHDALFVVPAICILVILVISKQADYILGHALQSVVYLLVAMVVFLVFFFFGWLAPAGSAMPNRISFAFGSGVNNTALGIVIGFLYFGPEVSVFLVATEPAWVTGIVVFKSFLEFRNAATPSDSPT